jgi:opacity protein-like surface antigen
MKLSKLLAVALLAPAVVLAAPTKAGKSASSTSTARPAASSSKTSATTGSPMEGLEVGGFVGYETDDVSGLSLRLDGELPFRELSPQVKMSLVGSFGYSYLTDEPGGGVKVTAHVIKLVPAARFTMPLNEQFDVFGDAGLGLAYVKAKVEFPGFPPFVSASENSDSTINIMMRLGVGAWYHVNPQLKVGAMLEFDPVFGDFGFSGPGSSSQSLFLIQIGGMFKI